MQHSIPINTSFQAFKHFNISPNFTYNEAWHARTINYTYNPADTNVIADTTHGFARSYRFSTGMSATTRIYGTFQFKGQKLKAIRHTIVPTVGVSYSPDFSDPKWGMYKEVQINEKGETILYSPFQGNLYSAPGRGESGNINFGLQNIVEAKVANTDDTAAKAKKVSLLDNLSASGNYNVLADSFNLGNISLVARTTFLNGLIDLNLTGQLDPYSYDVLTRDEVTGEILTQYRRPELAISRGQGLGFLNSFQASLGTNLNPNIRKKKNDLKDKAKDPDLTDAERAQLEYIYANPDLYVDFDIPWSLTVNYIFSASKQGFAPYDPTQTLNFSGDVEHDRHLENWFSVGL